MDPGYVVGLGVLWLVFNLFGRKLKTMNRPDSAEEPRRPLGRRPMVKKVTDRTSLESASEARSLEEDVRRPERAVVDADDEAEAIVAKRIAAAEANARPLGAAEHSAFDARVRQEPADATATKGYSMRHIRNAVVWREILGLPVSLRDQADS